MKVPRFANACALILCLGLGARAAVAGNAPQNISVTFNGNGVKFAVDSTSCVSIYQDDDGNYINIDAQKCANPVKLIFTMSDSTYSWLDSSGNPGFDNLTKNQCHKTSVKTQNSPNNFAISGSQLAFDEAIPSKSTCDYFTLTAFYKNGSVLIDPVVSNRPAQLWNPKLLILDVGMFVLGAIAGATAVVIFRRRRPPSGESR